MNCPNYNTVELERKVGQHLQCEDRSAIQQLRRLGYSNRAIGRELARPPRWVTSCAVAHHRARVAEGARRVW